MTCMGWSLLGRASSFGERLGGVSCGTEVFAACTHFQAEFVISDREPVWSSRENAGSLSAASQAS